jgi:hypothetical protein
MVLADEHIVEFQALWKKHYGTDITKAQALEKGLRIIRLIEAVSRASASDEPQPLPDPVGFLEKHRQQ